MRVLILTRNGLHMVDRVRKSQRWSSDVGVASRWESDQEVRRRSDVAGEYLILSAECREGKELVCACVCIENNSSTT